MAVGRRDDGTAQRLIIRLPLPLMPSANSRTHWRVRHKASRFDRNVAATLAAAEMRKCASWQPFQQATVFVEWHGRGRLPDVDNIGGRTKAYLDGLTDANVWRDDACVQSIQFTTHRISKGQQPYILLKVHDVHVQA